ncbi:MAG: hypothetical protein ACRETO_00145 [Gammaproteobacteria bacterium]
MTARQFYVLLSVLVISQVLGFGLLLNRLPPTTAPDRDVAPTAASDRQAVTPVFDGRDMGNAISELQSSAMRNAVENVLRDALVNVLHQPVQAASSPAAESAPTTDQQAAAEQAMGVIDTAISAGVWTQQDNVNLMPYAVKLTHAQKVELIDRFVRAMQNGQIILKGPPPVL